MERQPEERMAHFRDQELLWMEQWKRSSKALEEIRKAEIQRISEADSVRKFNQLEWTGVRPVRDTSGLVEQQRIFKTFREKKKTG